MDLFQYQWNLLRNVHKNKESVLDDIIDMNDISPAPSCHFPNPGSEKPISNQYSLPLCAQQMLRDGVTQFQRVSCFRLAVHLKRLGLPFDVVIVALKTWALKNRPMHGANIIGEQEIINQAKYVFRKDYRGYGCDTETVAPFCQPQCPVSNKKYKKLCQEVN